MTASMTVTRDIIIMWQFPAVAALPGPTGAQAGFRRTRSPSLGQWIIIHNSKGLATC